MNQHPFIIDNGSGFLKCGLAEELEPSITLPTLLGHPKYQNEFTDIPFDKKVTDQNKKKQKNKKSNSYSSKTGIIGTEALKTPSIYNLKFPIKSSQIINFEDLYDIYFHIFYKLAKIEPSDFPVMITESLDATFASRSSFCEMFFEELRVPVLGFGMQPIMSLVSTGLTTGFVVESGHGSTQMSAIYEGYILPKCCSKVNFWSGENLNSLIQNYLSRSRIFEMDVQRDFSLVTTVKHKFANLENGDSSLENEEMRKKVSWNTMYRRNSAKVSLYEFPDGSVADMSVVSKITSNMFFNNQALGFESENLPELIRLLISRAEIDLRRELMGNLVLNGGNAGIPGLKKRLLEDLSQMMNNSSAKVAFYESEQVMEASVWQGCSIMCEVDQGFGNSFWVTRQKYAEEGDRVINKFIKY